MRLDARPAAGWSLVGWMPVVGCAVASKVTVGRGEFISCDPGLVLK